MADERHTQAYACPKTGTIVQESSRTERWLARFGAIPHWLYFKELRLNQSLWAKVIIWISGIGAIMCLTGIVVGIYRSRKWRKIKKKGLMSFSPYKKKWFRWHHILGMTFGIFTFTFVLSGMFSLTELPQWLMPMDNSIDYRALWHEKASAPNFTRSIQDVIAPKALSTTKQIQFTQIDSNSYYLLYTKYRVPIFINARTQDSLFIKTFSNQEIAAMVKQKFANYAYSIEKMTESDNYYNANGNTVAKIRFQDQNRTWIYISTANPHQLRIIDKNTRFRRWLYKALHTFNFPKVREFEWLRITLLLIANTLGTLISITSVVLAYGYFKRKLKKHRRKHY